LNSVSIYVYTRVMPWPGTLVLGAGAAGRMSIWLHASRAGPGNWQKHPSQNLISSFFTLLGTYMCCSQRAREMSRDWERQFTSLQCAVAAAQVGAGYSPCAYFVELELCGKAVWGEMQAVTRACIAFGTWVYHSFLPSRAH
jgi:hypothetical protein